MRTALLAILPPVSIWAMVTALIWAVNPAYMRERVGRFVPLFFAAFVAIGELLAWLAQSP